MELPQYKDDNLTYYSLRHHAITERVRARAMYQDVARVAGTSVAHIENMYLHVDDEMDLNTALCN